MTSFDPMQGTSVHLGSIALQICYQSGELPALVFVHGGLGNRFNWRPQWEYFRQQGRAVLAYDLAGHGQSGRYARYSIGRHQRDLTRLLKYLGIHSPILCCHSYGVPIGLEWAQRHSIQALVAIGGGMRNLTPWWEIPLVKMCTWGGRRLFQYSQVQQLINSVSSSHQHATVNRFFQENPLPTDHHPYQSLESFWGYQLLRRSTPRHARLFDRPLLVITGKQDPTFPPEMGDALAQWFVKGHHVSIARAGHLVMVEYSDRVNQVIEEFIQAFAGTKF